MIMTNGFGAFIGGIASGWVVDHFTSGNMRDWQGIWFVFAGYALILGIIFPFVFRFYCHAYSSLSFLSYSSGRQT
jgi:NHS family xanthosine MFS transporter